MLLSDVLDHAVVKTSIHSMFELDKRKPSKEFKPQITISGHDCKNKPFDLVMSIYDSLELQSCQTDSSPVINRAKYAYDGFKFIKK